MLSKRYESTEVDRRNLATCALGDSLVNHFHSRIHVNLPTGGQILQFF